MVNKDNALISGHPGGVTPGTYAGMGRDFLSPGWGNWVAFALSWQDTRGKTRGICNA